jgi:hypothetical protein
VAKARRARPQPLRVVLPIAAAIVLIAAGALIASRWNSNTSATSNPSPSVMATQETAQPSSAHSSSTPSPSASDKTKSAAAQQTLDDCRAKVQAADHTVKEAKIGVEHWSEHVQAQTDANAGKISLNQMKAIFKRTRLDGPDDVSRYAAALKSYDKLHGACDKVSGAPAKITSGLAACRERSKAEQPVLDAAADAMADWKSHLAAMQRSRMGHVHDAQGVWIRTWRAAPPHIHAFHKAVDRFDAPDC